MAKLEILVGPEDPARVEQCRAGHAPRLDYRQIAECHDARVHQWRPAAGLQGAQLAPRLRGLTGNLGDAMRLGRSLSAGSVVFSTGETWGLPMALAGALLSQRQFTHIMYAHKVFSPGWLRFLRWSRGLLRVDGWICVTRRQAELLRGALSEYWSGRGRGPVHDGVGKMSRHIAEVLSPAASPLREPPAGEAIAVISQGVDTRFFDPAKGRGYLAPTLSGTPPYILSVGAEMRDYGLLFDAVRDLDVQVVVKASSSWAAAGRAMPAEAPRNVQLISRRLSYIELRDLYAGAMLVVVPLFDTPQAAGITTVLEAMAMGKCVVATESAGLPDCLVDGRTGIVAVGSSVALTGEITRLLGARATRDMLGAAGREVVTSSYRIEDYASQMLAFMERMPAGRLY